MKSVLEKSQGRFNRNKSIATVINFNRAESRSGIMSYAVRKLSKIRRNGRNRAKLDMEHYLS